VISQEISLRKALISQNIYSLGRNIFDVDDLAKGVRTSLVLFLAFDVLIKKVGTSLARNSGVRNRDSGSLTAAVEKEAFKR
jgi:hypothetical protein